MGIASSFIATSPRKMRPGALSLQMPVNFCRLSASYAIEEAADFLCFPTFFAMNFSARLVVTRLFPSVYATLCAGFQLSI